MENNVIFWAFGVIVGFILLRILARVRPEKDMLAEVLTDDKYKVKGQWDK